MSSLQNLHLRDVYYNGKIVLFPYRQKKLKLWGGVMSNWAAYFFLS